MFKASLFIYIRDALNRYCQRVNNCCVLEESKFVVAKDTVKVMKEK